MRSLEMIAKKDLVNRYLVTRSSQETINRMFDDLKSLYPGKSLAEIRDMLKENDWVIRTLNPNDNPSTRKTPFGVLTTMETFLEG